MIGKRLLALFCGLCLLAGCGKAPLPSGTASAPAALSEDRYIGPEEGSPLTFKGTAVDYSGSGSVVPADGCVTISSGGNYTLQGQLNGQLVIDTDKPVTLILNGCSVTSPDGPALLSKGGGELLICLVPGMENIFADSSSYSNESYTACLYAKGDLWLCGQGSLTVNGNYNNGIQSKQTLTIAEGNLTIITADDALVGKAGLTVSGGVAAIEAKGHGLKATGTDSADMGSISVLGGVLNITAAGDGMNAVNDVTVSGGTVNISAEDDGIHADDTLTISGGTVSIAQSEEALEAAFVLLQGGTGSFTASDDGINATDKSDAGSGALFGGGAGITVEQILSGSCYIRITGGSWVVDADGDGVDSNGGILMEGGDLTVYGPTSGADGALDYETGMLMNGGRLAAIGSAGMACAPGSGSTQNVLVVSGQFASGDVIEVSDGTTLLTLTNRKAAQNLVLSLPEFAEGIEISVTCNGVSLGSTALENGTSYLGEAVPGGMMGGFGGRGQRPDKGEMPGSFEPGQQPERLEQPKGFEGPQGRFPDGTEPPEGFRGDRPEFSAPDGLARPTEEGEMPPEPFAQT